MALYPGVPAPRMGGSMRRRLSIVLLAFGLQLIPVKASSSTITITVGQDVRGAGHAEPFVGGVLCAIYSTTTCLPVPTGIFTMQGSGPILLDFGGVIGTTSVGKFLNGATLQSADPGFDPSLPIDSNTELYISGALGADDGPGYFLQIAGYWGNPDLYNGFPVALTAANSYEGTFWDDGGLNMKFFFAPDPGLSDARIYLRGDIPVPEPKGLILLATGLAALLAWRCRAGCGGQLPSTS